MESNRWSWRWVMVGCLVLVALATGAATSRATSEHAYPVESIRLVIPFGRDGASDLIFREIASQMGWSLGYSIEIANVPGAAAIRGASVVRDAEPDGYIILGTHQTLLHSYVNKIVPYSHRDLVPVALLTRTVNIPTTWAGHPVQRADQIAPYIQANPGSVRVGVTPHSTSAFFWTQLFRKLGLDEDAVQFVFFPDSTSQVSALLGQEVDFAMLDMAAAGQLYKSTTLLPLGVAHTTRLAGLPDVATLREQGIDLVHTSNRGLFAPHETSPERLTTLASAFSQAVQEESLITQLELEFGSIIDFRPLEEFESFFELQLDELQQRSEK